MTLLVWTEYDFGPGNNLHQLQGAVLTRIGMAARGLIMVACSMKTATRVSFFGIVEKVEGREAPT